MFRKLLYPVLLFVAVTVSAAPESLSGTIIMVLAGDLVVLQDETDKKYTLRLEGIDAPEKGQQYSSLAEKKLSSLLSLSEFQVEITYSSKDREGNLIATIFPFPKDQNKTSVNKILVEYGYAWAYRKYSMLYVNDEEKARKDKLGLWAESKPIAPWVWRKQRVWRKQNK